MDYWFVWEIVVNTIENSFIYYLYSKQLGVREGRKTWSFIGLGLLITLVSLSNFVNLQMLVPLGFGIEVYLPRFFFVIPNIFYAILIFKGSLSRKIIWGIVPVCVGIAADGITNLIATLVLKLDLNTATQLGTERFPLTISYLLVSATIYLILANISSRGGRRDSHLPNYLKIFLFLLLLIGIIGVDQLIDISFTIANTPHYQLNTQIIFVNIAFLVILFSIFILIEYIGKLTQKNLDYALENQQKSLESQHYSDLETTIEAIKDARHDMKHHLQVIQGLSQQQNYEELEQYLNEVANNLGDHFDIVLTPNATINALLSSKLYAARSENIQFEYRILDLNRLPDHHMDLCSILGNLLDNAIEACRRIPIADERYIDLLIENRKHMLCITVENTFDGKLLRDGNQFLSRKNDVNHGRGLKNIQRLVKLHHGHIKIDLQSYRFIVKVFLPVE